MYCSLVKLKVVDAIWGSTHTLAFAEAAATDVVVYLGDGSLNQVIADTADYFTG